MINNEKLRMLENVLSWMVGKILNMPQSYSYFRFQPIGKCTLTIRSSKQIHPQSQQYEQ